MTSHPMLDKLGGTGPDVLLLHGYGSDRQSWLATAPALVERRTVWVMDLPAHGLSSSDCGDGSVRALGDSVLGAVNNAGLNAFDLIGHSLGGRISMHLAAEVPDRIQSLVAFAPAGLGDQINTQFLRQFAQAEDREAIHTLLLSLVHDRKMIGRALAKSVIAYLDKPGTREALQLISTGIEVAQDDMPATVMAIQTAQIPRLTIWGANDVINPMSQDNADAYGGSLQVYEDCGHLPHIERRVSVSQLLMEFYSRSGN